MKLIYDTHCCFTHFQTKEYNLVHKIRRQSSVDCMEMEFEPAVLPHPPHQNKDPFKWVSL